VQFYYGESVIAHFYIARNSVENDDGIVIISGSELGLGNKVLASESIFEAIGDLYTNP
jgi:hypothetical protein